jgi:predicted ArsR family transcriptional regulator
MKQTKLDKRFFESTRGRIVTLLRGSAKTVNDLSAELSLTDNAVRAHLLSLERDGLIKQSGTQPGTRKPHFAYELTEDAEHLFPKAYDVLLNELIGALKTRLDAGTLDEVLKQVGHSLATGQANPRGVSQNDRIKNALSTLEALGGAPRVESGTGKIVISSESCPLAAVVAEHPEVCGLAQALLSEIVGSPVKENCDRNGPPRCRFEVQQSTS